MNGRRRRFATSHAVTFAVLLIACLLALPRRSRAETRGFDPATAEADVARARAEGVDAFCTHPATPLGRHARALCPIAGELDGCGGLVSACGVVEAPKEKLDFPNLARFMAALGQIVLWLMIALVIATLAIPIVQAVKARRKKIGRDEEEPRRPADDVPHEAPVLDVEMTDAEKLLAAADQLARSGDHARAAIAYLQASLRALDARGAIRLARHRTHGEYVRSCQDIAAKPPLREIVREVDRVQFGHEPPTPEALDHVATRARSLVRALPILPVLFALSSIFALGACDAAPIDGSADPAGENLALELLRRQGMTVSRLSGSLATLPLPTPEEAPRATVIVDVERTPLEDDTRAHLVRWVEAGGVLVLAGHVLEWPKELGARPVSATSTEITVSMHRDDDDNSDDERERETATRFEHAKIARSAAIAWTPKDHSLDELGTASGGETYAAVRTFGAGIVLGLANDDLLTNAVLARHGNPAALVALLSAADRSHAFAVARPEDGIAPPSNPMSALHRAGLTLGLTHALAAAVVLFFAVGTRLARPRPSAPPARRAFAEHVTATGGLYARSRTSAMHALAAYARYADERVRAEMPRGTTDPATFLAARSSSDPARCTELWARAIAAQAEGQPRGDELETLRALSAIVIAATGEGPRHLAT